MPKKVTAVRPTGRPLYTFVALKDFEAPEFQSAYVKGQRYTVREGNTKLDKAAKTWAKNSFVKVEG